MPDRKVEIREPLVGGRASDRWNQDRYLPVAESHQRKWIPMAEVPNRATTARRGQHDSDGRRNVQGQQFRGFLKPIPVQRDQRGDASKVSQDQLVNGPKAPI